ncbi:MAG: hypothetical protein HC874_14130 [Richelia sp. SL_2_1]|nr:hypothetical protein [Richelia sp. SL_2_1]
MRNIILLTIFAAFLSMSLQSCLSQKKMVQWCEVNHPCKDSTVVKTITLSDTIKTNPILFLVTDTIEVPCPELPEDTLNLNWSDWFVEAKAQPAKKVVFQKEVTIPAQIIPVFIQGKDTSSAIIQTSREKFLVLQVEALQKELKDCQQASDVQKGRLKGKSTWFFAFLITLTLLCGSVVLLVKR